MIDPRMQKLAHVLVHHSMKVKPGENVNLILRDPNLDFARVMVQQVQAAGGRPFVELSDSRVVRALHRGMDEQLAAQMAQFACEKFEQMDCSMHFIGAHNEMELSDVPGSVQAMYRRVYSQPVDVAMRKRPTRWVVVQWPTAEAAQKAGMSTEAFEDFFFDVCCVDYEAMERNMQPLKALMERTDRVEIKGPGTDLSFSIKGIPAVPCAGEFNIPDGEIFTAPVRESVNGVITFNAPSVEGGFRFENICLTFRDGKCIEATANDSRRLNELLDTDEGARYVGEFAFGVNPLITTPMCDTLFDEKIAGSIHMAMGNCYEDEAPNGNVSGLHWDMICLQNEGGTVRFDGVVVRENGRFVLPELESLNPVK